MSSLSPPAERCIDASAEGERVQRERDEMRSKKKKKRCLCSLIRPLELGRRMVEGLEVAEWVGLQTQEKREEKELYLLQYSPLLSGSFEVCVFLASPPPFFPRLIAVSRAYTQGERRGKGVREEN